MTPRKITQEMEDYILLKREKGLNAREISELLEEDFSINIDPSTVYGYCYPLGLQKKRERQREYDQSLEGRERRRKKNDYLIKIKHARGDYRPFNGMNRIQVVLMGVINPLEDYVGEKELLNDVEEITGIHFKNCFIRHAVKGLEKILGGKTPVKYRVELNEYHTNPKSGYITLCGGLSGKELYPRYNSEGIKKVLEDIDETMPKNREEREKLKKERVRMRLLAKSHLTSLLLGIFDLDRNFLSEEEVIEDIAYVTEVVFESKTIQNVVINLERELGENTPLKFDKKDKSYFLNYNSPYLGLCGKFIERVEESTEEINSPKTL